MAVPIKTDDPTLALSITGRPYCKTLYPQFPAGDEMPADMILDIACAAEEAGFRRLLLTGTEPLRHPEILDTCYGISRSTHFAELGISTDGGPLYNMAPTLKSAGVNLLEIRLDTLQSVKYEFISGGKMADVRRGILSAERTGFLIRIMTRLMGGVNGDEVYDFCDLVKHHCFEQWFIELPESSDAYLDGGSLLAARRRLKELESRNGVRRFRVDGDPGIICLTTAEKMARICISASGELFSHGRCIDLAPLSHAARCEQLRAALEPEKAAAFSFQIVEE